MASPEERRLNIRFVFKSFNPNKRLGVPEGLFILIIVKEMRHISERTDESIEGRSQKPEIRSFVSRGSVKNSSKRKDRRDASILLEHVIHLKGKSDVE